MALERPQGNVQIRTSVHEWERRRQGVMAT